MRKQIEKLLNSRSKKYIPITKGADVPWSTVSDLRKEN